MASLNSVQSFTCLTVGSLGVEINYRAPVIRDGLWVTGLGREGEQENASRPRQEGEEQRGNIAMGWELQTSGKQRI